MKKVNVEDAVGMTLCHDITAMRDGFKGAIFKRGHVITEADIPELLDIGKRTIFIWEENAGELHEEDCARRLSSATLPPFAHATDPSEGKIMHIADCGGMFRVDTALLQEVNSIGDITITCLPDHYPVRKGMKLASMRIVPLVTKESQIIQAEELLKERCLFELKPYHTLKVGAIITGSEVFHGRIQDKFEPVLKKKLADYPSDWVGTRICDDDLEMIRQAASELMEIGAEMLIFTGGMSVDPDDLTPMAIRSLGEEIICHGVPAQPGNMTLLSYLGEIPLLGIPGAAISRPTTIFDVLLPAVFSGERITQEQLIRLAEGGLCQQCTTCHFPNCTFGRY